VASSKRLPDTNDANDALDEDHGPKDDCYDYSDDEDVAGAV